MPGSEPCVRKSSFAFARQSTFTHLYQPIKPRGTNFRSVERTKIMLKKFLLLILVAASAPALRAQTVAYVPNNTGTVDVINPSTDAVVATISGFSFPFCAAVSPNGELLYVCSQPNYVVAVNTKTNSIIATISLPGALGFLGNEGAAQVIAFSPSGELAFVVSSGGGVNSTLYVINTASNTVVSSASFGSTFLLSVAVSANGNTVYLGSSNGIIVVNANTLATITTIDPEAYIFDVAISPNGSTLYASDNSGLLGGTSGVDVVNTSTNTVTTTVPLPFTPSFVTGIGVTPDGQQVYVEEFTLTNPSNSTVTVINTATNSITTTIPANGDTLTALAITPDGSTVLAVNSVLSLTTDSTVLVIPTATNTITNSITVGIFPISIAAGYLNAPFAAFNVAPVLITNNSVALAGDFKLGANSTGFNLAQQPLTLTVGTLSVTIPPGSFQQVGTLQDFVFNGTINGLWVNFNVLAVPGCSNSYVFGALITGVDLLGSPEPVTVTLGIGPNTGSTSAFYF